MSEVKGKIRDEVSVFFAAGNERIDLEGTLLINISMETSQSGKKWIKIGDNT